MPSERVEKAMQPCRDLIAETSEEPSATGKIISFETLEDLAKTAEILARPIIHTRAGEEHTFYVIDGDTKYQHRLREEEEAEE